MMEFKYFTPSDRLKPFIKHYYSFKSDLDIEFEDTVFPSGDMEVIFNLGNGIWEANVGDQFIKNPEIELWGQITKPLAIKSKGRHHMLGIKFFTHSLAYFFKDEIGVFNNQVSNLGDIIGPSIKNLHTQLLEAPNLPSQIALLEHFLLGKLIVNERKSLGINKVAHILSSIKTNISISNINDIAAKHGITPRYLHQLLYQHTGLSPKSYDKINRFQRSLQFISKNDQPLTAIAYECGYFDQSHFIRDFKSFTGFTPSAYLANITPVNQLLQV